MVCTLKHLSLCPEMEALYLFNPENDMALACGDPYYIIRFNHWCECFL